MQASLFGVPQITGVLMDLNSVEHWLCVIRFNQALYANKINLLLSLIFQLVVFVIKIVALWICLIARKLWRICNVSIQF